MTAESLVEKVRQAVNNHDLEAVVDCFADDYRNKTPAHPDRGFVGREQVRTNWERIFTGLPDVSARIPRLAIIGDVAWTEWELGGHRADGEEQALRGVIIFGVDSGRFSWARFYLEPVESGGGGVDDAVSRIVSAGGSS